MHSSNFDTEVTGKDGGEVLVAIAALVTEGRIPGKLNSKSSKFYEGPHCTLNKRVVDHKCDLTDYLCLKFDNDRDIVLSLWQKNIPLCIEVLLSCMCDNAANRTPDSLRSGFLLEQWYFNINYRRNPEPLHFNLHQLVSAIRSQLYFSQITAWLTTQDENSLFKITKRNLYYRLTIPGETYETCKFSTSAVKHDFPATDIGNNITLNVSFLSLPRMTNIPIISCGQCAKPPLKEPEQTLIKKLQEQMELRNVVVDDRMHTSCTLKGKHRCEDYEDIDNIKLDQPILASFKRLCQNTNKKNIHDGEPSTSKPKLKVKIGVFNENEKRNISPNEEQKIKSVKLDLENIWENNKDGRRRNDLNKGQLLLDAIERSGQISTNENDGVQVKKCVQNQKCASKSESNCDMSDSDIFSIRKKNNFNTNVVNHCDSPIPRQKNIRNIPKVDEARKARAKQKLTFDDFDCDKPITPDNIKHAKETVDVPTPLEQAKFRKSLDNAASMVFHSRTGLPLTSSPAPVRRGKFCFDFDSSLNSVSAIKSALFSSSFSTDDESESDGSIVSPCSPETYVVPKRDVPPVKYHRKGHAANLLGSFEESVLNGRLEPVSTVHGFRAELGASGSFVPKHLVVPVTVFFYTLEDNQSSPYLSHINLGKKGYNVPKSGTVQVTLFNPLGTVVKMFVIMYDLSDMPPNSQTFIRQRTLYMPIDCEDKNLEWGPKWLRYLIHLRFMSSKSGKIYLHSDIRMIISRKSDLDTATSHGMDYELRSFTHMPTNPRFSPRK